MPYSGYKSSIYSEFIRMNLDHILLRARAADGQHPRDIDLEIQAIVDGGVRHGDILDQARFNSLDLMVCSAVTGWSYSPWQDRAARIGTILGILSRFERPHRAIEDSNAHDAPSLWFCSVIEQSKLINACDVSALCERPDNATLGFFNRTRASLSSADAGRFAGATERAWQTMVAAAAGRAEILGPQLNHAMDDLVRAVTAVEREMIDVLA